MHYYTRMLFDILLSEKRFCLFIDNNNNKKKTSETHRLNLVCLVKQCAEEVNDSPIEEVRLTVPITDDPTLPCLTFRTWTIGLTACVLLSFVNIFFGYRQNPISISSVCVQIVSLPIGKLMATSLPTKLVRIPLTNWSFSLNPGPFSLKEHVLITLFANAGASGPFALDIVTLMKAFYHRRINPVAALLLSHSTQVSHE